MLKTKNINSKLNEYQQILELYRSAFPENEKLPIWLLNLMSKRKCVDFLAFYDEDVFCGFTYLIHHHQTTFVLYLAINRNVRSKGYGSKILKWISDHAQKNIILNIETVWTKYENYNQRLSRQKFYFKNGFSDTQYKMIDNGEKYDVLYKGEHFSTLECEALLKHFSFGFYRKKLSR